MSASLDIIEPAEISDFRARRKSAAIASRGPASFVWGDFVVEPDSSVTGAAGLWSPLDSGRAGLLVRASVSQGITIGGALVDGEAELFANDSDGPTVAYFADGAEGVIFHYDATKYALQVWNPSSPWAKRFDDIDAFAFDNSLKFDARVTPVVNGRTVAITHHRDPRPVEVPVVAEVSFEHEGRDYRLVATPGGPGDGLFVHFTDETNGAESYSAGRGVRVVPDENGNAELDFNYATLLPCSFSLAWNCPLPAAENALGFAVRAGERNAVDANGVALV